MVIYTTVTGYPFNFSWKDHFNSPIKKPSEEGFCLSELYYLVFFLDAAFFLGSSTTTTGSGVSTSPAAALLNGE